MLNTLFMLVYTKTNPRARLFRNYFIVWFTLCQEEALSTKQVLGSLDLGSIRGFLTSLYHKIGAGRKPYNPVSMLKVQLLKHLRRVSIDRWLALLLKRNKRVARACGFRHKTPSHGLFTQFRHRLGKDGYEKVFSLLLKQLLKGGMVEGEVVALDSTTIKAYSQRSLDNKKGKSEP